ncbi:plastocyanin/azurin family copper-binding protein [Gemmatimonas sp.]|uniref:plastocyanin/azurin family copper-binding protein n=1 Tax=Gemmatimonas sp. TaxID=1962908 RepID=UPI00286DC0FE|nr:plastocyanin/azurin family copper-binding protein [Gemmatimonas sp.]
MSTRNAVTRFAFATASLLLVACGGEKAASTDTAAGGAPSPAAAPANAPKPTGTVITIEMITDETGNYFKPKEIEAKPGDVLKFVLVAGVHNVHFLADSNPGIPDLPPMSTFAQLPGQELLVPVNFAAGKSYYFQCDPHALLGMVGKLKVENE